MQCPLGNKKMPNMSWRKRQINNTIETLQFLNAIDRVRREHNVLRDDLKNDYWYSLKRLDLLESTDEPNTLALEKARRDVLNLEEHLYEVEEEIQSLTKAATAYCETIKKHS